MVNPRALAGSDAAADMVNFFLPVPGFSRNCGAVPAHFTLY
jgi:hypothetical protein